MDLQLKLKHLLLQCSKEQQQYFIKLYSRDLNLSIEEVISNLGTRQTIRAIQQAEATVKNHKEISLKKIVNNIKHEIGL
jgi:hypothetical protein